MNAQEGAAEALIDQAAHAVASAFDDHGGYSPPERQRMEHDALSWIASAARKPLTAEQTSRAQLLVSLIGAAESRRTAILLSRR